MSVRKVFGLVLLIIGFFLLGVVISRYFFSFSRPVSPIPDNDGVRVLFLSPQPSPI